PSSLHFLFTTPATTHNYTLSLHDALPIFQRHNHTQADLVDQLFNSSEKRLARALLLLARFGKKDKPEEVIPNRASNKRARANRLDRKSTRLNSSHDQISYAVFCLKKKKKK